MTTDEIYQLSAYDPWFLEKIREIISTDLEIARLSTSPDQLGAEQLRVWKQAGFADARIAKLLDADEADVRKARKAKGVEVVFNSVDTCGAEFQAYTPYL